MGARGGSGAVDITTAKQCVRIYWKWAMLGQNQTWLQLTKTLTEWSVPDVTDI